MNEALHGPPLLCMVVEDGYGKSCVFPWLIGGPILSKLELEPPMRVSSPRKVVHDAALRKPSFEGCRYGERRRFSFLMGDLIVSTTPIFGSPY
jgi:hypothetical protein